MIARIREIQKPKQKSQLNNCEIKRGAVIITLSRIPNLPISNIIKAAVSAMYIVAKNIIIRYIADIILWLLK